MGACSCGEQSRKAFLPAALVSVAAQGISFSWATGSRSFLTRPASQLAAGIQAKAPRRLLSELAAAQRAGASLFA